ncbi:PA2817 family protein [Zooshikella ganghwensis]|uniref:Dehydrogenase n=1 Tax=Zooshikella ganghwensis TaxID=202772 RepID=A0A4V1IND3_9GAMM|nr:PA2817 family protein [Zooshikella ganghwensis]RDH43331.1 dehydrogenase [Zooshikella ganghwensis]
MTDLQLPEQLQRLLNRIEHVKQCLAQQQTLFSNSDQYTAWLSRLDELKQALSDQTPDALFLGQEIISQLITYYPQLTPLLPRDLLWLLGGDCLHFMPDEEIQKFQMLEEQRFAAQDAKASFDWDDEVSKLQPTQVPTSPSDYH